MMGMYEVDELTYKVARVCDSCLSKEQHFVAITYADLAVEKLRRNVPLFSPLIVQRHTSHSINQIRFMIARSYAAIRYESIRLKSSSI